MEKYNKYKFTKSVIEDEENISAIKNIEEMIGEKICEDDVLIYQRGLCNGVECKAGYTCVLGNCVKDDVPGNPT